MVDLRYIKGFALWFTIFALTISVVNYLGYDDMGILFYLTSPPLWYTNQYSSFLRRFLSYEEIIIINFLLNVGFWFIFGLIIDWLRKLKHSTTSQKRTIGIRLGAIVVCLVIAMASFKTFYAIQNDEKVIAHVISQYQEYSSFEVRYCVQRAANQNYGKKYIKEMELIVKNTNDPEIYASTMAALGEIREQEALKVIIQNYGRFSDRYNSPINLAMNHKIILSMLSAAQSQEEINLAVKIAGILRYNEYIEPLKLIASKSTDDELRQEIFEVIDQIIKDPMKRNPK